MILITLPPNYKNLRITIKPLHTNVLMEIVRSPSFSNLINHQILKSMYLPNRIAPIFVSGPHWKPITETHLPCNNFSTHMCRIYVFNWFAKYVCNTLKTALLPSDKNRYINV